MRWLLAVLGVVVLAAAGFGGWVWFGADAKLYQRHPRPPLAALPPAGPDGAVRGAHLAAIYGCTDCHGDDLRGRDFPHPAPFERVWCANLTIKAKTYSDADIARVVRRGVRPDGVSVEFMPSNAFVRMTDADLAALIAFIRSVPAGGPDEPEWRYGWKARWELVRGRFPPITDFVAEVRTKAPRDLGAEYAAGRAIAEVACDECHGPDLNGDRSGKPPNLTIAGAYDLEDFRHFMRTGKAAGNRELVMMSQVARKRFSHLTDPEIGALHAYLVARAKAETS